MRLSGQLKATLKKIDLYKTDHNYVISAKKKNPAGCDNFSGFFIMLATK